MSEPGGFILYQTADLPDLPATGRLLRHAPSGARLVVLENEDPNHVFGIAFRTLPGDDTGVAHILEHSVLCGSARYPWGKPFVELLKGSLQTFLNAMTTPDTTLYAVASPNAADFGNLVDVYLDAVFAPLLSPETFRQEAWRIETGAEGAPALQGVVYNEMKGVLASPVARLDETLRRALFPETVYGRDYGGDPRAIPDLGCAAMRAFHARHYAPRNALLFCAGRSVPGEVLALIDDRLRAAGTGAPAAVPLAQPRFAAPRRVHAAYPGTPTAPRRDGLLGMGWMLDGPQAGTDRLVWKMLDELLVAAPNAAFRRALVETGLGEDLVQSGFSEETCQTAFRVGLTGTDPVAAERIEAAILAELARLAETGVDSGDTAAALNRVEFRLKEGPGGHFPAGIWQMLDAFRGWRDGGDPFAALRHAAALEALKTGLASGALDLREPLARLAAAPHRVTVALEADPDLSARQREAERERAAELARAARALRPGRRDADEPAPPGPATPVPRLGLADLPTKISPDLAETDPDLPRILFVPQPARGIVYLDAGFDLSVLPPEDLPLARFFGTAILESATRRCARSERARRIGRETGGIRVQTVAQADVSGAPVLRLFLRGKALAGRAGALCEILREIVLSARLDDPAHLSEILRREISRAETAVTARGHDLVARRIGAGLSEAGRADDALNGLGYLRFLRGAAEAGPETLAARLDTLRGRLTGPGLVLGVVADPEVFAGIRPHLKDLGDALSTGWPAPGARTAATPTAGAEAWEVPSSVNFVGWGGDLRAAGLAMSGATAAALRHLANTWIWEEVREKGGAYGGVVRWDPLGGTVTMASYRDPHLLETLEVFRGSAAFLGRPVAAREREAAIIAAIGIEDRPRHASEEGFAALLRYLTGEDREWRQARRDEVLAAQASDFARTGAALAAMAEHVAVLGGKAALDRAEAARPGWFSRSRLL